MESVEFERDVSPELASELSEGLRQNVLREVEEREQSRQSLEDELLTVAAYLNATEYRLINLLDEFDKAEGWCGDGIRSYSHWLNWKLGMGHVVAREKVRVARALRTLPDVAAAFRDGEISYSKVRAITRVGTPENEEFLLMIARHGTASHLEKLTARFRGCQVRLEREMEQPRFKPDCSFSYYVDEDGCFVFRGRLPADEGELLINAIEAMQTAVMSKAAETEAADTENKSESFVENVSAETFSDTTDYNEDEPHRVNQASALVAIAEHYLATGDSAANRLPAFEKNHLLLHINPAKDMQYLHAGHYVPDKVVKQFTCDCSITPVSENDAGNVISIGRKSRVVPEKMRFAIDHRDGGCCRFPGCTSHRYTDKHHIKHWSDGGETSVDNLITLCRKHHRLIHKGEFSIRAEQEKFVFVDRLDREIPVTFSPGFAATEELFDEQMDLNFDSETAKSRWTGEQMDYHLAVQVMFEKNPPGQD